MGVGWKACSERSSNSRQTSSDTMEKSKKQITVLSWYISVINSGYTYEPDVRHSEIIVKELGLEGAKTLSEHTSVRHGPREQRAAGSREVQEVSVLVRSSELLGHRQNGLAIRSQGMLQIDVDIDGV